jgi:hypothetical protein
MHLSSARGGRLRRVGGGRGPSPTACATTAYAPTTRSYSPHRHRRCCSLPCRYKGQTNDHLSGARPGDDQERSARATLRARTRAMGPGCTSHPPNHARPDAEGSGALHVPAAKGPRGEIVSSMGYPHEVVLSKNATGWRIASDQHDDVDLAGHSPDLVPGSWAAVVTGRPSNGSSRPPASITTEPSHRRRRREHSSTSDGRSVGNILSPRTSTTSRSRRTHVVSSSKNRLTDVERIDGGSPELPQAIRWGLVESSDERNESRTGRLCECHPCALPSMSIT